MTLIWCGVFSLLFFCFGCIGEVIALVQAVHSSVLSLITVVRKVTWRIKKKLLTISAGSPAHKCYTCTGVFLLEFWEGEGASHRAVQAVSFSAAPVQ